jgi:DNA (cytosine-5)-methyltransferase 1
MLLAALRALSEATHISEATSIPTARTYQVAVTHSGGETLKLGQVSHSVTKQVGSETTSMLNAAMQGSTVRRLTPTECERLMGWPDGWTVL